MNPKVGAAIAAVVLILAVVIAMRGGNAEVRDLNHGYFYDLQTNDVYLYTGDNVAPVTAPSGGVGVRAWVYTCDNCDDEAAQFVGYIQKYTDDAKAAMDAGDTPEGDVESKILLRLPEGDEESWVPRNSEDGRRIRESVDSRCPDGRAQLCRP